MWNAQLRQGKHITSVGDSDKHQGPFTGELGWYEVGKSLHVTHECQIVVTDDTCWRAEIIEPPEAPLDEEPAALMAKALSNPIYVQTSNNPLLVANSAVMYSGY